jgi:hypothetical protein
MESQRICKTCVLPESELFPLDSTGTCRLCRTQSTLKHVVKKPDELELEHILHLTKLHGKNQPYDCVVAWSGGRDSTYMLHELVRRHGLRCIAVFGRTPFTPEEIIDNVHSISEQLRVNLIEVQSLPNHREIASYCLKEFVRTREPILINLACASCKYINKEIFKQAQRLGVRTVIYGGNRFEYFPSGPASIDIDTADRYSLFNMVRDNASRILKGAATLLASPALLRHFLTFFGASILYVNQYSVFMRLRYPSVLRFDYFHFADWNEQRIASVLAKLGWELPPGCTSTWRADCIFEAVKNTAFKSQLGFTYAEAMFSNLIRANKMTRDAALGRLKKEGISEPRLKEALLACEIPVDAFKK